MKEKIFIVGAGGHTRVVIDLLENCGSYDIVGILDPSALQGSLIFDVVVLGDDSLLHTLHDRGISQAALGIGSKGDTLARGAVYKKMLEKGYTFPDLIYSSAIVSRYANIASGVQIMAGAIIQPGAVIGENSVVNTGAVVEHDCKVGENVFICPGVVLSGSCRIGDNTFVGSGATVIPEMEIGANCLIAAGAVVVKSVDKNSKVKGVPARPF